MLPSIGLLRAVVRRLHADWPVTLAAWLLVLAAATLLAAGIVFADAVGLAGVRESLARAPVAERAIRVLGPVRSDIDSTDAIVRGQLADALGPVGGEIVRIARSRSFAVAGTPEGGRDLVVLVSHSAVEEHSALVGGRWPIAGADPVEATLSEPAAHALGLAVGDEVELLGRVDPAQTIDVRVVGVWRADPRDPVWLENPLEIDGVERAGDFTTRGPFIVMPEDLVGRIARTGADLEWRAIPTVGNVTVDAIPTLSTGLGTLASRVNAAVPGPVSYRAETRLPTILAAVERSALVGRTEIELLSLQFAVLAGYGLVLVAGMLAERRRTEHALLASRGAGLGHAVTIAAAEALLITVPAVLVAPALAVAAVSAFVAVGPLPAAGIDVRPVLTPAAALVAAATGAGCVAILTLVGVPRRAPLAGVRATIARSAGRTFAQRVGMDVAVVVVAALALWQLRLYGAPLTRTARGSLGIDPLLVAAPGIGLLAGAIVAIRIVPRLAEIAERLLERPRGLVAPMGGRQLGRRSLRYTRSAMLVTLAVALGTFAVVNAETGRRSQLDQAAYQAVADVRVTARQPAGTSSAATAALRALEGVSAVAPVVREPLDVGRVVRGGTLLAIDPETVAEVVSQSAEASGVATRGAASAQALGELAGSRPATHAVPIPTRTTALEVVLDTDLEVELLSSPGIPAPFPRDWDGVAVAAVVEDGEGLLHRLSATSAGAASGDGQRIEIPLPGAGGGAVLPDPLRLHAVELALAAPNDTILTGRLAVRVTRALRGPGAAEDLPLDRAAASWGWTTVDPYATADIAPAGDPREIALGLSPGQASALFGGGASTTFRYWTRTHASAPLPAIVGNRFAALTGARPGDLVEVAIAGRNVRLRVSSVVDAFPPLDPTTPFAIVDGRSLALDRFADTGQTQLVDEWWVRAGEGSGRVAEAIAASGVADVNVLVRDDLARRLERDPIQLGVVGVLGLGAAAAMAFAAIGFVVGAALSTAERIPEFAILRALGLSARQLAVWLSLENAFLVVVGLSTGTALGLGLAWLVLPFTTLTATGEVPVPTPTIVVPWEALVPIHLLGVALLAITLVVIGRQLPRIAIASVLRAADE